MRLSPDDKRLLAEWARHPGHDIARRFVIELRKAEEAQLGADLYKDASSFNPVKVAEKAGRHHGRLEVLNQALFAAKAIEREQNTEGTSE